MLSIFIRHVTSKVLVCCIHAYKHVAVILDVCCKYCVHDTKVVFHGHGHHLYCIGRMIFSLICCYQCVFVAYIKIFVACMC